MVDTHVVISRNVDEFTESSAVEIIVKREPPVTPHPVFFRNRIRAVMNSLDSATTRYIRFRCEGRCHLDEVLLTASIRCGHIDGDIKRIEHRYRDGQTHRCQVFAHDDDTMSSIGSVWLTVYASILNVSPQQPGCSLRIVMVQRASLS